MRNLAPALLATLALAGCQPPPPEIDNAWVRLPAIYGRPAAGYFTAEGGARADAIVAVRTAAATRVEFHESMANGMKPMRDVPLPSGTDVRFAPAGRHLMLFGVSPGVAAGRTVKLEFEFDSGVTQTVDAKVVGPADPAP